MRERKRKKIQLEYENQYGNISSGIGKEVSKLNTQIAYIPSKKYWIWKLHVLHFQTKMHSNQTQQKNITGQKSHFVIQIQREYVGNDFVHRKLSSF